MSELQSFFEPTEQPQTSTDLPLRLAQAARDGDLDTVQINAEGHARNRLHDPVYTGDGIPETPQLKRRPGAVEAFLALLADVRAAGSFKRYANAPRIEVVVLQALCAKGRAAPYRSSRLSPPVLARLFPTSTKSLHLPKEIFWHILQFWRTDRDP